MRGLGKLSGAGNVHRSRLTGQSCTSSRRPDHPSLSPLVPVRPLALCRLVRKVREAERRWPSVAGSEAAKRGRTSSEGAEHADLPTRAAHSARSPLLAPPRLVPSPPLTTSTLGDQTRARTVAARSRPGSCCNRPLLLETGQAGHPPWASQTLNRSNSGVGAADGDTYDGGGRSCTNINKNQREKSALRVQIYLRAVTLVTFVRLRQVGGAAEFLVVTDPAVYFWDLAQPGLKIPQPPPLPGA